MNTSLRCAALAAAALLAATTLAGCAAGASESRGAEDSELLPAAEGATEYPLTLSSPWGETTLTERPERIAVIGAGGELEATIALGVTPVVISETPDSVAWFEGYAAQLADAEPIDVWGDTLAYESILAASPDLIINMTHYQIGEQYERLSDIAPVLTVADESSVGTSDWREITTTIGEVLDLSDRADEAIAETEAYVADAAEAHPEYQDRTVAFLMNRGVDSGIEMLNIDGSDSEQLFTDLGFAPHPQAEAIINADGWGTVSLENLSLVDADALIVRQHGGEGSPEDAAAWLEASAIYQRLGAVQAGAVQSTDESNSDLSAALSYPDVVSIRWAVDRLQEIFVEVFPG